MGVVVISPPYLGFRSPSGGFGPGGWWHWCVASCAVASAVGGAEVAGVVGEVGVGFAGVVVVWFEGFGVLGWGVPVDGLVADVAGRVGRAASGLEVVLDGAPAVSVVDAHVVSGAVRLGWRCARPLLAWRRFVVGW